MTSGDQTPPSRGNSDFARTLSPPLPIHPSQKGANANPFDDVRQRRSAFQRTQSRLQSNDGFVGASDASSGRKGTGGISSRHASIAEPSGPPPIHAADDDASSHPKPTVPVPHLGLDVSSRFHMLSQVREASVLKHRQGSVLTRGLVLKTDYFAGMRRPDMGVLLQGAPNFRQADVTGLQVYGVAQPTVIGLKTILSVLQCAPLPSASSASKPSAQRPAEEERGRPLLEHNPSTRSGVRPASSSPARGSPSTRAAQSANDDRKATSDRASKVKRCVWACTRNEPVIYVGGRPFVLREAERPLDNFQLSERADNLESIEERLKSDIMRESVRYGGLLMVHEEDERGGLRSAWISVGADEVKTVREVFDDVRRDGWRCDYHRIPIAEDQPMENNYLDAYTQIIKEIDPLNTAFVANCGLGVRRTSFAMVAAVLVRRRQMILLGYNDPLQVITFSQAQSETSSFRSTPDPSAVGGVVRSMQAANQQQSQEQSTLQVVKALSVSLAKVGGAQAAVDVLLNQPLLLNALRSAKNGDYGVIGQLVSLLDHGAQNKQAVDLAIDACAHVINLRHSILESRIQYAVAAPDQETPVRQATTARNYLRTAVHALEQYYFLITFASYVEGSETAIFQHRFATWLRNRAEIWHTISKIRSKGEQLYFFEPIADLSALSRGATAQDAKGKRSLIGHSETDPHLVPGDEFADHVVRNRSGLVLRPHMLLKEDVWRSLALNRDVSRNGVRGALNFRRIPHTNIFACGQPTLEGIYNILRRIKQEIAPKPGSGPLQVTYINLREEPICYVNGKPFCLRQKGMSLRNIKSYSGISWSRLALLEDRLKNDVLTELVNGDGRLLLHTETQDGGVVPIWEESSSEDVQTLQDVMGHITKQLDEHGSLTPSLFDEQNGTAARGTQEIIDLGNIHLIYRRQPVTAEKPPHFEDVASLTRAVIRSETQANACIVLNCQLGRGRSTLMSIMALLVSRWLKQYTKDPQAEQEANGDYFDAGTDPMAIKRQPMTYHLINSLLRVIPHGLEVKQKVDEAIDQCASVTNVRDAIEDARIAAEEAEDDVGRREKIQNGVNNFRRYFQLLVFQAYLDATPPVRLDTMPSFEEFVRNQPVLSTFWSDTEKVDISTITPLQKVDSKSAGQALNEEVQEVVSNRAGRVLSSYTMLKSDMFPGLAAQALSQIEGIPNMRGVNAVLGQNALNSAPTTPWSGNALQGQLAFFMETWGHGMPSISGLRKGLERIGGGPGAMGKLDVIATSLREEAVCVINGRPHVLRLADQPFTNVETTGISTEAVERMEQALKQDVLEEIRKYNGKLLLHDETVDEKTGRFELFPIWEDVKEEDVLTPKEMYQLVKSEGYRVFYSRVAVTDEQAPIPAVFHEMEERVLEALRRGAACVWNCQMGRGRTTTGMVIAALVSTIAQRGEELFSSASGDMSTSIMSAFSNEPDAMSSSAFLPSTSLEEQNASQDDEASAPLDNREESLWLQGEYRTVLQIVAILRHGKLAKRLTDSAIDRMEAVQNLRKAIYDSKIRALNADAGTKKRATLMRVYRNYLERYAYLIIFSNYLLEKAQAMIEAGMMGVGQYASNANKPAQVHPLHKIQSDSASETAKGDGSDDDDDDDDDDEQGTVDGDDGRSSVVSASVVSVASTSLFARQDNRRIFPTFISWLEPRREISSILNRDELE